MIKTIAALFAIFALTACASGGFDGPGATSRVVPVTTVNDMEDDTKVILEGYLIKQIRDEHYIFKDNTGEIEVEIDDEDFRGANVTPKTKLRISGEVDKDWESIKIDVDYLEILE
jgi:uncharacterized protein (TIGR00156 family)